jgi:flagellar biosynthetic protein FliQ
MDQFTQVAVQGLMLVLILSLFPLIAGLIVGFVVSLFQALTQIQDQTLTFVPKIVTIILILLITIPWMLNYVSAFARETFELMIKVGR